MAGHSDSVPALTEPLLTDGLSPNFDAADEAAFDDEVAAFTRKHNLAHRADLFRRAAALLHGVEVPGLTDREAAALEAEIGHKWRQPKTLYHNIGTCSFVAIAQGWAQVSMNGANLYYPAEFGIDTKSVHDAVVIGLINCAIYLAPALVGAWLSGPINDRVGRRGTLFWGTLISFISAGLSGLVVNWPQLLASRFILGVGLGINAATCAVFAAESSPTSIRGGLAVSWQMFVAFGVFVGFVANILVQDFGDITWRLQLTAPLIPTIFTLIMVYLGPESPAWYIKSGRYDGAFASLCRLRNTELQAARELYGSYLQSRLRDIQQANRPLWRQLLELVTIPRVRRATTAAYVVMIAQQLCGINIVAFYSSSIFADSGFSKSGALMASAVFGFVNFVFAFPAVWTMDTLGRRSLLILTLPLMAVTMIATGFSFYIPEDSPAHFFTVAALVYLFCALYSPGMGPVPNTYSAEVFPLSHREVGMSMAVATTSGWAAVLSLTFPSILGALDSSGAFILYGFLNVLALLLVFLLVPETRQKSLDELDGVFSIPTRQFVKYQVTQCAPWAFRRYILRQKQSELPPLTLAKEYRQLGQEEDDME